MQTQFGCLRSPGFYLRVLTAWVREAAGSPRDSELPTPRSFPEMVPTASRGSELLTLEVGKIKLDPTGQGG